MKALKAFKSFHPPSYFLSFLIMSDIQDNPLALQIKETKVSEADAVVLSNIFLPFSTQADQIKDEVYSLQVTSSEQTAEIKQAREYRLKLKGIRLEAEKAKKREKEESLRKGQAIDSIFRYILSIVEPMEEHLDKQENFVKLEEAKQKQVLKEQRERELQAFAVDTAFFNLADMPEESYAQLLATSQTTFQLKKEAAEKTEKERIERERIEAEEREKIRIDNERLRKEAEAHKEALEAERKERERIEGEIQTQKTAEEKAKREQEEKQRQSQLAPDKEKLVSFADRITSIQIPDVSSKEARAVVEQAIALLSKASQYVKTQSLSL